MQGTEHSLGQSYFKEVSHSHSRSKGQELALRYKAAYAKLENTDMKGWQKMQAHLCRAVVGASGRWQNAQHHCNY